MDMWNNKTQGDARKMVLRNFVELVRLTCDDEKDEGCSGGKFHGFLHDH
jgi:hypothetical protein